MKTDNAKNSINLDAMPVWDFTVRIRGVDYPMVSPLGAADLPPAEIPAQAELDAQRGRWPGLLVWAWRGLFGAPRLRRSDIPADGGAAHTRAVCVAILGEGERALVEGMKTAQCSQLIASYMQCQERWLMACAREAGAVAAERYRDQGSEGGEASGPDRSGRHQGGEKTGGMVKLIPGQPFPFENRMHPNLTGAGQAKGAAEG